MGVKEKIMESTNYFKEILISIAKKSTCDRLYTSAIIVKDNYIISTGYNGAPRKRKHCNELHLMKDNHCVNTIHAELNAILNAAKNGINIDNCDMYCLNKPCFRCMMVLINSGIKNCYYFGNYEDGFQDYFVENKFCKFIKI